MKPLFFIFIFLIYMPLSLAYSLSGSPSNLIFNLEKGVEECKTIEVYSQDFRGDLYSLMRWAGKDVYISNPNDFEFSAEELNLDVNYFPEEIENFDGEEKIEVCISGQDIGVYRGSLEYRTVSEGNVGIGVGTWIKVIINKSSNNSEDQSPGNRDENSGGGGAGGGSSGGGSSGGGFAAPVTIKNPKVNNTKVNNNQESRKGGKVVEIENDKETEKPTDENLAPVTGAVIGGKENGTIIVVVLIVLIIAGAIVYNKRNKSFF